MKKKVHKTLNLEKFTVAKLTNPSSIYGGAGDTADGEQGETITNNTKMTVQRPTNIS